MYSRVMTHVDERWTIVTDAAPHRARSAQMSTAVFAAPTTTTFATDVVTESLSTLPPRYAEYERRSERVSRGTGSWSMGEEQPPAY